MDDQEKEELRQRDIKIWLLRRGDNLTLQQIGDIFSLHRESVRQRIRIIDYRITRGWTKDLTKGPTPGFIRRLRLANALVPPYSFSPSAYDVFNSTAPEKS